MARVGVVEAFTDVVEYQMKMDLEVIMVFVIIGVEDRLVLKAMPGT